MADSRSFLANQKARNAIVGAENLLIKIIQVYQRYDGAKKCKLNNTELFLKLFHIQKLETTSTTKKQQNLKNGKVRVRLNIDVRKEMDSRLNAIEVRKRSTEF